MLGLPQHARATDVDALLHDATSAAVLGAGLGASPPHSSLSAFERRLLQRILAQRAAALDPAPQGKRIARIHFAPQEVFDEDDLFPLWLNLFHTTTRPEVLEHALLLAEGEQYEALRIAEARRALLDPFLFSTVQLYPLQAADPDEVELLVLSKDLWSLRFNTQFQLTGSNLDYLAASISENNFAGRNVSVAASFLLEPDVFSIGPSLNVRRLFSSHHMLTEYIKFSFGREDGNFEGAFGTVDVGLPLYSLDAKWGWMLSLGFKHDLERQFSAGRLLGFGDENESIPWVYRDRWLRVGLSVSRAFDQWLEPQRGALAKRVKHELSWGWNLELRAATLPDEVQASEALLSRFRAEVLPLDRRDSLPFISYRVWEPEYAEYLDLDTLGLMEELQLGHDASVSLGLGLTAWGSDQTFVHSKAEYAFHSRVMGDDLFGWEALASARVEQQGWRDIVLAGALRYASPAWFWGRLHLAALYESHVDDAARIVLGLGGDNGLRGYASAQWLGSSLARVNLEWRSLGVELWTTQLGAVAFLDMGDAFDEGQRLRWHSALGLGLRWLLPQFNRVVARLDWGFPLEDDAWPGRLNLGFEQAF
jgi:hypothetical protein